MYKSLVIYILIMPVVVVVDTETVFTSVSTFQPPLENSLNIIETNKNSANLSEKNPKNASVSAQLEV